ncbi:MAG: hypothetical protein M1817_003432 [Caeruleum heppii]|nr:MAG: hypothetical protein M1817_003432 [Caeruleum heppii]
MGQDERLVTEKQKPPQVVTSSHLDEDLDVGDVGSIPDNQVDGHRELPAKSGKRRLFGLGRKQEDINKPGQALRRDPSDPAPSTVPTFLPGTTQSSTHSIPPSSSPVQYQRSTSPGIPSPASSQIFERNVQESTLPSQASPAIPSHIQTEDHIPPVLEASSLAITDDHLGPDNVEIVTHAGHQPAVTVAGPTHAESGGTTFPEEMSAHPENDETTSNYGSLDTNDIRRLSFISFADVVQAEHTDHPAIHDSLHSAALSSTSPTSARTPSPSPSNMARGRISTPPTSVPTSFIGPPSSPPGQEKVPGSPISTSHGQHSAGELNIETMRQALRKTESSDLSGVMLHSPTVSNADEAGSTNR